MYASLLVFHSFFRWLVLISLIYTVFYTFRGWLLNKPFSTFDSTLINATTSIVYIQFTLGMILYFTSPVVDYFLNNFSGAVHERLFRFFGMEHSGMMFVAVSLISMGSSFAKKKETDQARFKTTAIWFGIALLLILIAIPWPFSPMAARPYFRFF